MLFGTIDRRRNAARCPCGSISATRNGPIMQDEFLNDTEPSLGVVRRWGLQRAFMVS